MQRIRGKLPVILIALLAIFIVIVGYFGGTKTGIIKPLPTSAPATINISNVELRNFEANPVRSNTENDSLIVDNDDYQIAYVKAYNQFLITINNKDFENTRQKAEAEFLKNLNITSDAACKLNVSISTPTFANPDLSGQIFPLSFCN